MVYVASNSVTRFSIQWPLPLSPNQLSTFYAYDTYLTLGLGELTLKEAEQIGKSVLHTAMNACLKHSKGGGE